MRKGTWHEIARNHEEMQVGDTVVGVVGAAGTAVVAAGVTTPITVPQTSGGTWRTGRPHVP
jgi:hypothetical protein